MRKNHSELFTILLMCGSIYVNYKNALFNSDPSGVSEILPTKKKSKARFIFTCLLLPSFFKTNRNGNEFFAFTVFYQVIFVARSLSYLSTFLRISATRTSQKPSRFCSKLFIFHIAFSFKTNLLLLNLF